jgi:hypothetical protein
MGDQDVNGKTGFEPPPWEREAFDALAARRADEQMTREVLEAAAVSPGAPIQEPPTAAIEAESAAEGPGEAAKEAPAPKPATDERVVQAMLVQLQSEERADRNATKWVAWAASGFTVVVGLAMLIAGLLMIGKGGGTSIGAIGSAVLSVFGLVFIGMAAWVWITTSRSRGR